MNRMQFMLWLKGNWRLVLVTAGLMGLAALAGQLFGNYYYVKQVNLLSSKLEESQKKTNSLTAELSEQLKQNDYLTAELAVEKSAGQLIQQELKTEQQKLFDTRKELAFYQRIISPELQADSLIIDSFSISPGASPTKYRFNLVLIQQDKQRNFAKGSVDLKLHGFSGEKRDTVDLLQLAGFNKSDKAFSFKYFQIIEGEFSLPEGFKPEKVDVALKVAAARSAKSAKVDKSFYWPTAQPGEILE
ncbi:MAG: hypothetical protein KJ556_13335 [Gammaproteobacteria bacterium]|nr:hypothetical protein [Gammaproteobacteria bacterium]MBU2059667.1 hypothetical protein [Gammaproteobacteria bacterium]MBU2176102.1 hypothetical protein [Gammaproteobacteria bacterium]MBU2245290.1 hypothetical protein [Gammaproteobacteria bacterium]MBU2343876.1 hypothetical protein [Gammaproteobacteria bacterium]